MTSPDLEFYSIGFVHIPTDPNDLQVGEIVRYSEFVRRLFKQDTPEMMKSHAAIGVAGEAGELGDAIKREIHYGHTRTKEHDSIRAAVLEELGDLGFKVNENFKVCKVTRYSFNL